MSSKNSKKVGWAMKIWGGKVKNMIKIRFCFKNHICLPGIFFKTIGYENKMEKTFTGGIIPYGLFARVAGS